MSFRNVIIIICVVLVGVLTYQLVDSDKKFKDKIKALEQINDSLHLESLKVQETILKLSNTINLKDVEIDSLKQVKEKIKIERYEIPVIVDSYPVTKLDSILTNYVHPRGN